MTWSQKDATISDMDFYVLRYSRKCMRLNQKINFALPGKRYSHCCAFQTLQVHQRWGDCQCNLCTPVNRQIRVGSRYLMISYMKGYNGQSSCNMREAQRTKDSFSDLIMIYIITPRPYGLRIARSNFFTSS